MLSVYLSLLETEAEQKTMIAIYEQYRYYCIFIAKKLLSDHNDAEDATHAAFLEIIKHKDKYFQMEANDFRACLVVIVKNKSYDILRLKKKEPINNIEAFGDVVDKAPSVIDIIASNEDYELLRKALKKIAPSYENILTMKYFEGLSNSEIAERLCITKKNVEVTLYRAKASLRKMIEHLERC